MDNLKERFEALSEDAKRVGAAFFGMGTAGTQVHFGMQQSRPTARTLAGLEELTKAEFITRENDVCGPGFTYKNAVVGNHFSAWYHQKYGLFGTPSDEFILTERIPDNERQSTQSHQRSRGRKRGH